MTRRPRPPLDDALPAPPRWAGAVSAAVGALGVVWLAMGLALWQLGGDPAAGAKALKYVLLACVPAALVGLILGLAGRAARGRFAVVGIALNALVLLAAAAVVLASYGAAFAR